MFLNFNSSEDPPHVYCLESIMEYVSHRKTPTSKIFPHTFIVLYHLLRCRPVLEELLNLMDVLFLPQQRLLKLVPGLPKPENFLL